MNFLNALEANLSKFLNPISEKMSNSKILRAISQGGLCRYPHNPPYADKDIMPS